jgi:gliding motility associated protien GldN
MKARRIIIGLSACTIFAFALSAQEVTTSITPGSTPSMTAYAPMTDVYKKETIVPEKKPVPYAYIREADVMWAKTIWRVIDLRQRANMALRYPVSGVMSSGERYNLVGLLMKGIETEEVTPYAYQPNVGWKDPFSKITTIQEINSIKNFADSVPLGDGSAYIDYNFENVLKFEIQEQWYFDKKHSTMNVRIIGLAPVWYDMYDENNNIRPEPLQRVPFIVYFPQCRRLFATHSVYNPNNDAQQISFDDLFFQRRFTSTIIAESNVMGNRFVQQYKTGQDILLEAERIKEDLFDMEHDLWEY